jgi:hypothetical protein
VNGTAYACLPALNIQENVKKVLKFPEAVSREVLIRLYTASKGMTAVIKFNQLVCPVSPERVDENRVRVTALGVILMMGAYFWTGWVVFPALAAIDFYIRAFTNLPSSPISWLAMHFVKRMGTQPIWIDKAPKIFAARIGLLLTLVSTGAAFLGWNLTAYIAGSTLVLFAFFECGLNFCAGCWVYTYVVYPMVRKEGQ